MNLTIIYILLAMIAGSKKSFLVELNDFIGKATVATYAGSGKKADPVDPGVNELPFSEGKWRYLDRYSGFFQSWGLELVWYDNIPIWAQTYGGGMVEKFMDDIEFAHETFTFLKAAMRSGEKRKEFQPRGPNRFSQGDWNYSCEWSGDICRFKGSERITFRGEVVFTHDFVGGLVIAKAPKGA
jgi:hypothetical protein